MTVARYLPQPSALLPSFIAENLPPCHGSLGNSRRPRKVHPTSYLDGLRGLAAASVFAYHYTDYNHKFFLPAYGDNPSEEGNSLLQLPYIRVLYAGTPMVHVFFVISGFALAYRPLKALHSSPHGHQAVGGRDKAIAKCHNIVASSALRRPFRLFGPPLALTLLDVFLVQLGFMGGFLKKNPTVFGQIAEWAGDAINAVTWPWGWDTGPHSRYNPHLWTIPIEFSHSMLLFLVLAVVARLRTTLLRRATFAAIMTYSLFICGRWASFEFLAGAFLADLHLDREMRGLDLGTAEIQIGPHDDGEKDSSTGSPRLERGVRAGKSTLSLAISITLLLFAGFIISWPPRTDDITPAFTWLQDHAPPPYTETQHEHGKDFWFALAALALVYSVGCLRPIQRFLESPVPQYAGKVSFAFYILQHPILNICEHPVLGAAWKAAADDKPEEPGWGVRGLTGQDNPLQRTVCWFIGLFVLGFMVVWPADIFTRAVDAPCVRLAKRIEGAVFVPEEPELVLPVRREA